MSTDAILKVLAGIGLSTWGVQIVIHLFSTDTERRRIGWRLVAALFAIMAFTIVGMILYYKGIDWFIKALPTILIVSIIMNYHGWLLYLLVTVSKPNKSINKAIEDINARIDSLMNERNSSIVKLPDNFKLGPKTPSGVTINQILKQLVSTSSAEQKRSIARSYLGQFVTWKCKIYSWESIGNGQLEFTLGLVDGIHPSIFVKALESESAHIKALPPQSNIIIADGRICEICTLSRNVTIDYADLTFDKEASSHPSGAAPSPSVLDLRPRGHIP